MIEKGLIPIHVPEPPRHTKIKNFRCATCKKNAVCTYKDDYLKTAILVERVIGNPQLDREEEVFDTTVFYYWDFRGMSFDNTENYFPDKITTTDNDNGFFMEAVYLNKDLVKFMYKINGYYVLFQASWDKTEESYVIYGGRERYYGLKYTLSTESEALIQVGLGCWRVEMEKKEEEAKEKDIINTTFFNAQLDCDQYEFDKEKVDCMKRHWFSPMEEYCKYHHVATYHIEPEKVPIPPQRRGDIK